MPGLQRATTATHVHDMWNAILRIERYTQLPAQRHHNMSPQRGSAELTMKFTAIIVTFGRTKEDRSEFIAFFQNWLQGYQPVEYWKWVAVRAYCWMPSGPILRSQ